jgi:hypothetical protein
MWPTAVLCCAVQVAEFDAFTKSMGPEFTVAGKNTLREVHILSTSGVIQKHGAFGFVQPFEAARSVGTTRMQGRYMNLPSVSCAHADVACLFPP